MKRLICVVLVLFTMVSCLTACTFSNNLSGGLAGKAEAAPKVEQMMSALAENRVADAKALMHPQMIEKSDAAISQIITYIAGRDADSIEQKSINVKTSTGTSGKTRQEQMAYKVTLTDGTVIYLNVVYISNKEGNGFATFQVVLGVI